MPVAAGLAAVGIRMGLRLVLGIKPACRADDTLREAFDSHPDDAASEFCSIVTLGARRESLLGGSKPLARDPLAGAASLADSASV